MAAKVPVKANFTGSDVTSLGEFASGDTIDEAYIASLTASKLTGALPAISGANLTNLPAAASKLSLSGGTMSGNIVMGTNLVDGVDISARDGILTSTTTTANAAMPKAGGAFSGNITTNGLIDTRDVAADGVLATNALPKGGGTMTGALAINTADNALVITSTGGGRTMTVASTSSTATDAPEIILYKNSSSPAANDQIGYVGWHSNDNAGNDTPYASIYTNIDDVTNGSEDGSMHFKVRAAGANAERLTLTATGVTVTGNALGTMTTDNDGSFAMSASNNFKCTPGGNFALTFTSIVAQSGNILFINSGGHTISAHANTKVDATLLATISTAGTYLLAYFSDGTNVYMTNSAAYA